MDSRIDENTAREDFQKILDKYDIQFDDDRSIDLMVKLRAEGFFNEQEWVNILFQIKKAMDSLVDYKKYLDTEILNINADPRNAEWIKIVGVWRLTGYKIPNWAALWLWNIYNEEGEDFWNQIGKVAQSMRFEKYVIP